MKVENEKTQKVFVDQEGAAILKCPVCSLQKPTRVDPSLIRKKDLRESCIARCKCQARFAVTLEFRRDFRKPTELSGEFICLPKGKNRGTMKVVNVAKNGIGLEVIGSTQFKIGDELLVLFNLDDNNATLIEKKAVIRFVKENYIGCEFPGSFPLGNALSNFLNNESPTKNQLEDSEAVESETDHFDWDSPRHWR